MISRIGISVLFAGFSAASFAHDCGDRVAVLSENHSRYQSGFLSKLSEKNRRELEAVGDRLQELWSEPNPFNHRSMAEEFGQSFKEGDSHSVWLKKLGFYIEQTEGKTLMLPPKSIGTVFDRYNAIVDEMVAQGLSEEQAVRPGIVFRSPRGTRQQYIRPGIDKLPPETWKLISNPSQLEHLEFYRPVAQGVMPLDLNDAFFHDLAHLTDFLETPQNMQAWRDYGRQTRRWGSLRASVNWIGARVGTGRWGRSGEQRSLILGEGFSLPDVSQAQIFRDSLPHLFGDKAPKILADEKDNLRAMPPDQRHQRLASVNRVIRGGLKAYGAVTRDRYNHLKHDPVRNRIGRILWGIENGVLPAPQDGLNEMSVVYRETLASIRDELFWLERFRYSFSPQLIAELDPEIDERHLKKSFRSRDSVLPTWGRVKEMPSAKRNEALDALIVDRVAKMEMAIKHAVEGNITFAKVLEESRTQKPSPDSATANYLRSYVEPGTLTYEAFQLSD